MSIQHALQRLRAAVFAPKDGRKQPKISVADVEKLLDRYDLLDAQARAGLVDVNSRQWRDPIADPPPDYVPVLVKLECGYVRVGRRGRDYWAFAEFLHTNYERNKHPPISQRSNPVVGWLPLMPEAAP